MECQVVTGIDFSLRYCKGNTFKALLKIKLLWGDVWPVANVFGNLFSVKLQPHLIYLQIQKDNFHCTHQGLPQTFPIHSERCKEMNHRFKVPLSSFPPNRSGIEDVGVTSSPASALEAGTQGPGTSREAIFFPCVLALPIPDAVGDLGRGWKLSPSYKSGRVFPLQERLLLLSGS